MLLSLASAAFDGLASAKGAAITAMPNRLAANRNLGLEAADLIRQPFDSLALMDGRADIVVPLAGSPFWCHGGTVGRDDDLRSGSFADSGGNG
ncbi:hypothetical protein RSal33209_0232 [Renibacterium salmoninarum ATCC 33209]|uniref:Uncharacterized protein n=1 Tax=Renibacterium salmoninarum (strain ATCC 33209 / DSM 20767 / JCM 11484 / NBRC 15589 / NCIMB 2235) TaxID=288705 RepID=A9WLS3_RENSM|nr:hypothetical protein RSal33209_0232 [Renibacterium salmoninarum ATCC 33209]